MRKMKRFEEGGSAELPEYEREPSFEDKAQQGAAVAQYKMDKGMNPNLSDDMTFKEAFKAARENGDKTFTWRGKKYTTEMAAPKPKEKSFSEKAKERGFTSAETKGGAALMTRKMKSGGAVSASKRADGCAMRGKTRGRMV